MADQFSETTVTGYGTRIIDSIKGVLIGLILFVVSFGVLYWNEGRVDLSQIAKKATEVSATTVSTDSSLAGKLVSTTGVVNSDQIIGDGLFLKPDKYLIASRQAEMYAWVENRSSSSQSSGSGSKTTTTTYNYVMEWTDTPQPATSFKTPEGHTNPTKTIEDQSYRVTAATIGAYSFDPTSASLPGQASLTLSAQNTTLSSGAILGSDKYVFVKNSTAGTFAAPQLGDLRVSYTVLQPGFTGTIFGALQGSAITSYTDAKGTVLYRVLTGTRDQGIAQLKSEFNLMHWGLRLGGFLLMWFGLATLLGPITVIMDFFPIFGAISASVIWGGTFLVALILSVVTIVVAVIAHSIVAMAITAVVAIGLIWMYLARLKRRKMNTAATPPTPPVV